jgi:hypothetical protein
MTNDCLLLTSSLLDQILYKLKNFRAIEGKRLDIHCSSNVVG